MDIGAHFITGNKIISAFKSNQIREPDAETTEPVQKIHP